MALWGGVLVACTPVLAFAAVSGMEVPLEGALLAGTLLLLTRRAWTWAALLAGLAALVRPEGVLAVAFLVATCVLQAPRRELLRAIGLSVLLPLGLAARNVVVSGRPLPATFYVKANPGAQPLSRSLERGLVEVLGGLEPVARGPFWAFVAVALALGAVALFRRRRRGSHPRTTMIGGAAALALAYAGGISALSYFEKLGSFYYQRYVAPPLPLLVASAVAGMAWLAWAMVRAGQRWAFLAAWGLALAAALLELAQWPSTRARFADDVASTTAQQVAIGRWIDANVRPDGVVWTIDAGAVRYWGRRRTVDLVRLNTPELFDGVKLPKEWWPSAIVVIPEIFQTAARTPEPLLQLALVAESPVAAPGARDAWRHEVHRCLPGTDALPDNRVFVLYEKQQVIATGHCAP
jgi:hypothetical protein